MQFLRSVALGLCLLSIMLSAPSGAATVTKNFRFDTFTNAPGGNFFIVGMDGFGLGGFEAQNDPLLTSPVDDLWGYFTIDIDNEMVVGTSVVTQPRVASPFQEILKLQNVTFDETNTSASISRTTSGYEVTVGGSPILGSLVAETDDFEFSFTLNQTLGLIGTTTLLYTLSSFNDVFVSNYVAGMADRTFHELISDYGTIFGEAPPGGVIPIPTALPLLLTAIAGLGAIGWRRRGAM